MLKDTPLWKNTESTRVCVSACATLSLSAVFCDVREAMETVSGWLLASPRLSASSLVSLRSSKMLIFQFRQRYECVPQTA